MGSDTAPPLTGQERLRRAPSREPGREAIRKHPSPADRHGASATARLCFNAIPAGRSRPSPPETAVA